LYDERDHNAEYSQSTEQVSKLRQFTDIHKCAQLTSTQ
jgi:hypothetical protein